jgi:hypothetical protein
MRKPNDDAAKRPPLRVEPEGADADRILARRASLVAAALGGLALPFSAACAGPPQPCLSIAQFHPDTFQADPPSDWQGIWIASEVAARQGLPMLGLRAKLTRGGFTVLPQRGEIYASASGPPGGPLSFRAVALRRGASSEEPESAATLLRGALEATTEPEVVALGPVESVAVAKRFMSAQAIRTGRENAATDYCLVRVPQAPGADTGMLLVFGVPAQPNAVPSCLRILDHEALRELVDTIEFDGG